MSAKDRIDIIVARYMENARWTTFLPNNYTPIIYNKGSTQPYAHMKCFLSRCLPIVKELENVGREAHTYLYHIINNYDQLAEINIFCQAHPFDHEPRFLEIITDTDQLNLAKEQGFFGLCPSCEEGINAIRHPSHPSGLPMFYWFDYLFGYKLQPNEKYHSFYGAQFMTTKKYILNRPIEFYKLLMAYVSKDINPEEAYVFERLWPFIFNSRFMLSDEVKIAIEWCKYAP